MTVKLYLIPNNKVDEVIEVYSEEDYPLAFIHLDTFWQQWEHDRLIYNALNKGETVTVELRMVIDPCLDPQ